MSSCKPFLTNFPASHLFHVVISIFPIDKHQTLCYHSHIPPYERSLS
jgi:hypothetical protein